VHAAGAKRYFVDGVKTYGVHREFLHRLARDTAAGFKATPPEAGGGLPGALRIAGGLFRSGNMDEAAVAIGIVGRFQRRIAPGHFATLNRWVSDVQDWASCDSLCGDLIGPLIRDHPHLVPRLVPWTRARHRWRRRAAVVSLIPLARTGARLPEIFGMARRLLGDADVMVQKGVGWLLKEATRQRADRVLGLGRERADGEEERVAREEGRHHEPRLAEDDRKEEHIEPRAQLTGPIDQVLVQMDEEVEDCAK
jgi:3-methyladenine DNA glycosylase AlkD